MMTRKQALAMARHLRTCPPPEVRDDPRHAEAVARHTASCTLCTAGDAEFEELAAEFARRAVPAPGPLRPVSGGLHFLRRKLGGWSGETYFNPPLVAVIEAPSGNAGSLLAAQAYHDPLLAAPGDLIVPPGATEFGGLFIECWHTYTLRVRDLGPEAGRLAPEVLDAVAALRENPGNLPRWAARTKPMAHEDVRLYFRDLEVSVSRFFAARSTAGFLQELGPLPRLAYESAAGAAAAVARTGFRPPDLPAGAHPVEVLEQAESPVLQEAAAGADGREPANLVWTRDGRILRMETAWFHTVRHHEEDGVLEVAAEVTAKAPAEGVRHVALFQWHCPDGTRLRAATGMVRRDGPRYRMRFFVPQNVRATGGHLLLTIIAEEPHGGIVEGP